ncbi:hypothetical protein [Bacillus thuringiensis]|uniref:hypothetical protein n=1 Tax=Bacillus thuringiensis TaxID=1428 RepID=UPI002FBDF206
MQIIFEMIKEGQNLNSELNKLVVEPYIAETGIKREEIQLSELAKWMEDKVENER